MIAKLISISRQEIAVKVPQTRFSPVSLTGDGNLIKPISLLELGGEKSWCGIAVLLCTVILPGSSSMTLTIPRVMSHVVCLKNRVNSQLNVIVAWIYLAASYVTLWNVLSRWSRKFLRSFHNSPSVGIKSITSIWKSVKPSAVHEFFKLVYIWLVSRNSYKSVVNFWTKLILRAFSFLRSSVSVLCLEHFLLYSETCICSLDILYIYSKEF